MDLSYIGWGDGKVASNLLVATLDRTPLPLNLQQAPRVQIFGDEERSEKQRIDDLIVNLYWLIYQNTRQNQLS